ncbi:hypothetical protein [Streptomyces sp. NPDC046821]|uniref:hypothetical protein n=1 Tax=Streptomyces sp. NPDC046821 TaxID=3154702 RepID=UPI003411BB16
MTTDPTAAGCTDPCIACMTGESHDPAPAQPVETDEERADREETERAHAEGEHAFCGLTCETELPTEHLRNFVVAKGYPGTKGALDELLRRARAETTAPLASADPCHSCGCPRRFDRHADGCPLRDRIAEALATADGLTWGPGQDSQPSGVIDDYHRRAAAALAVLPAPADRAAVLREAANGLAVLGPVDSLVSAPAAWTEAIETLRRMADQIAEDDLRRMADEAQQQEPPCCSDPTCTCVQVNADGLCECVKWGEAQQAGEGR